MIGTLFINLVAQLVNGLSWVLQKTPDVSVPQSFIDAIIASKAYLSALDVVLPVSVLVGGVSLILGTWVAIVAWGFFNWVLRRLPTQD
jgi:phage-related minor tail protein